MARRLARLLRDEWLLAGLCALAVAFAAVSQGFGGDAWKFPTAVGALTAALAAAEVLRLARAGTAPPVETDAGTRRRGLLLAGWFLATLAAVYVLGLLVTVAVSTALYFRVFLETSLPRAAALGLGHALVFWVSFELLAGFRLWSGLL